MERWSPRRSLVPAPGADPRSARWIAAAPVALRLAVAAGAPPGTASYDEFPHLAARVGDWDAAFAVAGGHRLDAFLAYRLRTEAVDLLPQEVIDECRGILTRAMSRHHSHAEELDRLREGLAAHGIPTLAYKGPPLAARLYATPFLRVSRDLDLFVPADRVDEAIAAIGHEWERVHLEHHVAEDDAESHQILVRSRRSGVLAEIHRSQAPASWGISTATLTGLPADWPLPGADPDDGGWPLARLLPTLAAHGLRHGYVCLFWLADVAALVARHPEIDWDEVWRVAAAARVATALGASLLLAEGIFATRLPGPQGRRARRDPAARALAVWIAGRIARDQGWDPVARGTLQTLTIDGWPRRARTALRFALTPSALDREHLSLPRGLDWLHAPLRPVLVGFRFLRRRARGARP